MSEEYKKNEPEQTNTTPTRIPHVDIFEYDEGLVVVADMPGVDEKNLHVDFDKGILAIRGEVTLPSYDKHRQVVMEYKPVNYLRNFAIPEEIDVEKVTASIKNGVVMISLPKSPKPKARRIPIITQ